MDPVCPNCSESGIGKFAISNTPSRFSFSRLSLSSRVVDTLRAQVPKNYEWPGNFRELEQAVRNVIVRNEYVPVLRGEESNRIETVYENTEVSLAQWSATYARKAFENAGSYREAARRLKIDQRTLKKLVES